MSGLAPVAVLCGIGLGVGLWLLVSLTPRLSRPGLVARVAPYVVDVSLDARDLMDRRTVDPLPVFALFVDPIVLRLLRGATAILGGGPMIARRLRQAGLDLSVDDFRSRQLVWAAVAAGGALVLGVVASGIRSVPLAADGALVVAAALAGFLGRDYLLQRAAKARLKRMTGELPTVLEFMTLSLSAGEGILDALRRISQVSHGELATELATVVRDVGAGLPLAESLTRLSTDLQLPPLTRAVEQMTGALERGTPLAEVLRAQAQDARDEAKRELLEVSGRKEVAMLVPLVFFILPVTIVIAIFPGIFVLQLGIG